MTTGSVILEHEASDTVCGTLTALSDGQPSISQSLRLLLLLTLPGKASKATSRGPDKHIPSGQKP